TPRGLRAKPGSPRLQVGLNAGSADKPGRFPARRQGIGASRLRLHRHGLAGGRRAGQNARSCCVSPSWPTTVPLMDRSVKLGAPAGPPISPPTVTEYRPDYLPAYLSNGLIGLRVGRVPFVGGNCIVNGLVERDPVEDGEGFAQGPYPIGGDVVVDGHRLTWLPEQVRFITQSYDFSCGELHTVLVFRPQQVAARVETLVFCSRSLPTLVLKEVAVEVDGDCNLTLTGAIDPAGIRGNLVSRRTMTPGTEERVVDGLIEWQTRGGLSSCGAAYTTTFHSGDGV